MKPPVSFSSTLLTRFFIAALIPVILLGAFTYTYISRQLSEEIADKNQVIAQAAAGQIASLLAEPVTILTHTGHIMEMAKCNSLSGINDALNQAIKSSPFFESVYILDRNRNISHLALKDDHAGLENFIGMDMSGLDLYPEETDGGLHLSRIYLSPLSGRKSIDIAIRVYKGQVLAAGFNIDHIRDVLMGLSRKNALDFFVSDNVGNLVFNTQDGQALGSLNISNLLPLQQALAGEYGTFPFKIHAKAYVGTTAAIPLWAGTSWWPRPVMPRKNPLTVSSFFTALSWSPPSCWLPSSP